MAIRGREDFWSGLKWLCLLNEIDADETIRALRTHADAVRARTPETGVHPRLAGRIGALLLWLTGDEDNCVSSLPKGLDHKVRNCNSGIARLFPAGFPVEVSTGLFDVAAFCARPIGEHRDRLFQRVAQGRERVVHAGRYRCERCALHEPVTLKSTQGERQHAMGDPWYLPHEFVETVRALGQMSEHHHRPLVSDAIDNLGQRAAFFLGVGRQRGTEVFIAGSAHPKTPLRT